MQLIVPKEPRVGFQQTQRLLAELACVHYFSAHIFHATPLFSSHPSPLWVRKKPIFKEAMYPLPPPVFKILELRGNKN